MTSLPHMSHDIVSIVVCVFQECMVSFDGKTTDISVEDQEMIDRIKNGTSATSTA